MHILRILWFPRISWFPRIPQFLFLEDPLQSSPMLSYLFWPNPPAPSYDNPKVVLILVACALMIAASFALKAWRKKLTNSVTRKLTKSYGPALFWFGLTGLFLVVCRVEGISYLSMRFWWVVLGAVFATFVGFQLKIFRMRHYEIIPNEHVEEDIREKYLPKKKK